MSKVLLHIIRTAVLTITLCAETADMKWAGYILTCVACIVWGATAYYEGISENR